MITDTPISTNPDAPLSFSHLHALCVRGLGARARAARALLVRMGGTHRHPFEFLVDSRFSSPPPILDSREFWRNEIFGARLTRVCARADDVVVVHAAVDVGHLHALERLRRGEGEKSPSGNFCQSPNRDTFLEPPPAQVARGAQDTGKVSRFRPVLDPRARECSFPVWMVTERQGREIDVLSRGARGDRDVPREIPRAQRPSSTTRRARAGAARPLKIGLKTASHRA